MLDSRIWTTLVFPFLVAFTPAGLLWNWIFYGDMMVRETFDAIADDFLYIIGK